MVYLDTSVLVALCTHEAKSAAVSRWYAKCSSELVSAAWCVTEFASASGLPMDILQCLSIITTLGPFANDPWLTCLMCQPSRMDFTNVLIQLLNSEHHVRRHSIYALSV